MLPDVPCTPSLPYLAEADHYSGPACVQMILNACPNLAKRNYNSQADIYASILSHNSEPTTWFSDPDGIEGALEDPVFSPCGNWVDYSNTAKYTVLGKMLYWMKTTRYLAPVSISANERWVTVIGYQTDIEPPYSDSVTLQNIFFYDPLPGSSSYGWVNGAVWLSDTIYWGVPLSKAGSAWNNKYIAIIEPPKASPRVVIPKWILEGPILPVDKIKQYANKWLENVRREKIAQGPFEILRKKIAIDTPILIKASRYSYYLVPFKDSRLVAIFNAYNGSFEELRYFDKPQKYVVTPKLMNSRLEKILKARKIKIIESSTPELRFYSEQAPLGRFSPVWEVQAAVKDPKGKNIKLPIIMNINGEIIRGL